MGSKSIERVLQSGQLGTEQDVRLRGFPEDHLRPQPHQESAQPSLWIGCSV